MSKYFSVLRILNLDMNHHLWLKSHCVGEFELDCSFTGRGGRGGGGHGGVYVCVRKTERKVGVGQIPLSLTVGAVQ